MHRFHFFSPSEERCTSQEKQEHEFTNDESVEQNYCIFKDTTQTQWHISELEPVNL